MLDVERTGDRRPQRDLNRDDHAAVLERIDDPAQPAKRHAALGFAGVLEPIHRSQHSFENDAHVIVGPGLRFVPDAFNRRGRREIVTAEPDVDVNSHPLISFSSALTVVTGARHEKSRQT